MWTSVGLDRARNVTKSKIQGAVVSNLVIRGHRASKGYEPHDTVQTQTTPEKWELLFFTRSQSLFCPEIGRKGDHNYSTSPGSACQGVSIRLDSTHP